MNGEMKHDNHIHTYTYTHAHTHMYIHTCTYTHARTHMHVYIERLLSAPHVQLRLFLTHTVIQ